MSRSIPILLLVACAPSSTEDPRGAPTRSPVEFRSPDSTSVLHGGVVLVAGPGPSDVSIRLAALSSSGGEWGGLVGTLSGEGEYRPAIAADGHLRIEYHPSSDDRIVSDRRGNIGLMAGDPGYTGYLFRSISLDVDPAGNLTGTFVMVAETRWDRTSETFVPGPDVTLMVEGTLTGKCTRFSDELVATSGSGGTAGVTLWDPELTNPICQQYRNFM